MRIPFFNVVLPRISLFFLAITFLLFLYSFTQVDLGLTLTRASVITDIQRSFQYIGYFNRSLSALLFLILLAALFASYIFLLRAIRQGTLNRKTLWATIILGTLILTFSYNAFSYDIFNYIFDAKILTMYGLNPYEYKALDFPSDPMLSFMHWTHRTYPYGPVWLGLSVPLSYLGFQFFMPTFFLFKLFFAGCFLLSCWFIEKIVHKVSEKESVFCLAFFAFNPLILIESLVSGHNDIAMMALALGSIYFLVKKRYILAVTLLILSVGLKYATGFLLPLFIVLIFFDRKRVPIQWGMIWLTFLVAMIFGVGAASLRSTFQPWYLLYVLPFASLIAYSSYIRIPFVLLSLVGLLNYLPYLYYGNWDPPIPAVLLVLNLSTVVIAAVLAYILFLKSKTTYKKIT